jgi:hypothetical protein
MNKFYAFFLTLFTLVSFQSCNSTKITHAWKAEESIIDTFKRKKVLVIARTANDHARIAFESEIADALREKGIKSVESYTKAPKIHPNKEMSEERLALIRSLMKSEGFNAVVLTVIKDKKQTVTKSTNGIYAGISGYPSYYGGFYDYYRSPYAYGNYYSSFGGYIPTSTSTYTSTDYVLESVAYNLDEAADKQLVAVVTSSLKDPKSAYKSAEKLVAKMVESLDKQKK